LVGVVLVLEENHLDWSGSCRPTRLRQKVDLGNQTRRMFEFIRHTSSRSTGQSKMVHQYFSNRRACVWIMLVDKSCLKGLESCQYCL